jgi:hypothetical protein
VHTSISCAPAPTSVDVRQQLIAVSFEVQLVPLHLVEVWLATPLKGSAPIAMPTLHSDEHAIGCEFVQRVGRSFAHV